MFQTGKRKTFYHSLKYGPVRYRHRKPSTSSWCLQTYEAQLDAAAGISTPARDRADGRAVLGADPPATRARARARRVGWSSRAHRTRRCRRRSSGTLGHRNLARVFGPRHNIRHRNPLVPGTALPGTEAGVTRPHSKARLKPRPISLLGGGCLFWSSLIPGRVPVSPRQKSQYR